MEHVKEQSANKRTTNGIKNSSTHDHVEIINVAPPKRTNIKVPNCSDNKTKDDYLTGHGHVTVNPNPSQSLGNKTRNRCSPLSTQVDRINEKKLKSDLKQKKRTRQKQKNYLTANGHVQVGKTLSRDQCVSNDIHLVVIPLSDCPSDLTYESDSFTESDDFDWSTDSTEYDTEDDDTISVISMSPSTSSRFMEHQPRMIERSNEFTVPIKPATMTQHNPETKFQSSSMVKMAPSQFDPVNLSMHETTKQGSKMFFSPSKVHSWNDNQASSTLKQTPQRLVHPICWISFD